MMIMMVVHDGDADHYAGGLSKFRASCTQINLAGDFPR